MTSKEDIIKEIKQHVLTLVSLSGPLPTDENDIETTLHEHGKEWYIGITNDTTERRTWHHAAKTPWYKWEASSENVAREIEREVSDKWGLVSRKEQLEKFASEGSQGESRYVYIYLIFQGITREFDD